MVKLLALVALLVLFSFSIRSGSGYKTQIQGTMCIVIDGTGVSCDW